MKQYKSALLVVLWGVSRIWAGSISDITSSIEILSECSISTNIHGVRVNKLDIDEHKSSLDISTYEAIRNDQEDTSIEDLGGVLESAEAGETVVPQKAIPGGLQDIKFSQKGIGFKLRWTRHLKVMPYIQLGVKKLELEGKYMEWDQSVSEKWESPNRLYWGIGVDSILMQWDYLYLVGQASFESMSSQIDQGTVYNPQIEHYYNIEVAVDRIDIAQPLGVDNQVESGTAEVQPDTITPQGKLETKKLTDTGEISYRSLSAFMGVGCTLNFWQSVLHLVVGVKVDDTVAKVNYSYTTEQVNREALVEYDGTDTSAEYTTTVRTRHKRKIELKPEDGLKSRVSYMVTGNYDLNDRLGIGFMLSYGAQEQFEIGGTYRF